MRPGGPGKRARNNRNHQQRRGGGGGGGGGNRNQSFDSNGPEVKVRGSAAQVAEKYVGLARDASSAGDRVAAENYLQHAEHYTRIVNANNERAAEIAEAARERAERERQDEPEGNAAESETVTAAPEGNAKPASGGRKKAAASQVEAPADADDDDELSQPAA